jgi:hypothetical protein
MRKFFFISVFLLVFAAIAGGIVYWKQNAVTTSNTSAGAVFAGRSASSSPEGSITYQNAQYGFALAYPKELSVFDRAEAGGSYTFSFESQDSDKGFQVFVLPYNNPQIALSRIQEDTHNTAAGTPQEAVLPNGTHALVFESRDPLLGAMREVWFLHGGYLFEVTGYVGQDDWLAGVLSTWRFLE